jgi:hypothetical protein
VKDITRSYLPAPWIYLVITLVGIVNPTASVIGFGGFALFWVIESSVLGRARQRT